MSLDQTLTDYVTAHLAQGKDTLADKLLELLQNNETKDVTKKNIIDVFNEVYPDIKHTVTKSAVDPSSPDAKMCQHENKGKSCKQAVTDKSKTGNYCTRHAKIHEKEEETVLCTEKLKSGERKNQECGKTCVGGETMCKTHIAAAKKKEK